MGLTYPSNKICPRCGTSGYVWYLGNSEYVAKCTNCGHYFRREDFPVYVLDEAPKPITNADRIRAMTDKELAEFITPVKCVDCRLLDCGVEEEMLNGKRRTCQERILDWLKQVEDIESVPSADVVERKRGKWIKDCNVAFFWKCSECGAYIFWRKEEYLLRNEDEPNYCPNCGADMRGR